MATFYILLGAPGAGKGTQAKILSAALKLPHISSGEIFRENIAAGTELGIEADDYISRGDLVPDDITNAMIRERLRREDCAEGAILDGFPRTMVQAEALARDLHELGSHVSAVLSIDVPQDVLVSRLSGRWMCREKGHVYHEVHNPPREPGVCDIDGSELYQREDDKPETVAARIQVYLRQTAPLIDHFEELGLLRRVNGDQEIEEVTESLQRAIAERKP
jgi:adenylate kinase